MIYFMAPYPHAFMAGTAFAAPLRVYHQPI